MTVTLQTEARARDDTRMDLHDHIALACVGRHVLVLLQGADKSPEKIVVPAGGQLHARYLGNDGSPALPDRPHCAKAEHFMDVANEASTLQVCVDLADFLEVVDQPWNCRRGGVASNCSWLRSIGNDRTGALPRDVLAESHRAQLVQAQPHLVHEQARYATR